MSWLDLLLCITKNTALWLVECDKFKTFLKCSGNPSKTGEIHANRLILLPQRMDPDLLSFLSRFTWKVFPFKSFPFLVYSVYINVEKVYQRLLQCVAQLGNHWPNHVQVSWRKLLAACVSWYQQEFCRKFTPSEQMQYCFQWQTLKI